MKNLTVPLAQESPKTLRPLTRIAFRKRVEALILELPQRLFGIEDNCFKIRISNRFLMLLLRKGLNPSSSPKEIQATLENLLSRPLSRFIACGQLTFGDILLIRASEKNNQIEIERISRRHRKTSTNKDIGKQSLL